MGVPQNGPYVLNATPEGPRTQEVGAWGLCTNSCSLGS